MKLELNLPKFLKTWQMAERTCGTKSTINAMNGILITAGEETVIEATDFKTSIRCSAEGVQTISDGLAILPVKILGDFLKKLNCETATLEVSSEKGTLTAGRNKMRFPTSPVEEFPGIPKSSSAPEVCSIMTSDLIRVINEGSIASAVQADFPKYLGTCLFRIKEGTLNVVSTDSKRLSLSKCPCGTQADKQVLLPIPALKELCRLLGNSAQDAQVQMLSDDSTAWFRTEGVEFSIRCVESSFPNYEKILTSDVMTTLRINRDDFLPALERMNIIARTTVSHIVAIKLSPGGELRMTARAPDLGTALEVLDATIDGDPLQIGFNAGYLEDGLKALGSGESMIEFNGEEGQTRITQSDNGSFLYMLMPARLSPQDLADEDEEEAAEAEDE